MCTYNINNDCIDDNDHYREYNEHIVEEFSGNKIDDNYSYNCEYYNLVLYIYYGKLLNNMNKDIIYDINKQPSYTQVYYKYTNNKFIRAVINNDLEKLKHLVELFYKSYIIKNKNLCINIISYQFHIQYAFNVAFYHNYVDIVNYLWDNFEKYIKLEYY